MYKKLDKLKSLWYNINGNKSNKFSIGSSKKCPRETVKSYPGDFFMYARAHGGVLCLTVVAAIKPLALNFVLTHEVFCVFCSNCPNGNSVSLRETRKKPRVNSPRQRLGR